MENSTRAPLIEQPSTAALRYAVLPPSFSYREFAAADGL
jgi:hypothetical protein